MVGSESEFLVRIRILQQNSDYFGFGSTTLELPSERRRPDLALDSNPVFGTSTGNDPIYN
jgi:hypothetical protein